MKAIIVMKSSRRVKNKSIQTNNLMNQIIKINLKIANKYRMRSRNLTTK